MTSTSPDESLHQLERYTDNPIALFGERESRPSVGPDSVAAVFLERLTSFCSG
jgi:hypothetical protein